MGRWLSEFRGALLTWAAVPGALGLFAAMAMMWAVAASYHPMAPIAFQGPFLLALVIATLLALLCLAVRHSAVARRARVWRNLGELCTTAAGFVLAAALIMIVVTGPKTMNRVLFGETYQVPTAYRPHVAQTTAGQDISLVLSVCGPLDAPVYQTSDCPDQARVSYGDEAILQQFDPNLELKHAGARHSNDILHDPGRHHAGEEPGEIIYRQVNSEMRLWLDPMRRVQVLRFCNFAYRDDCTAMVRVGPRVAIFPVHDKQATSSKAAMMDAAKLWVEKIESWRCAPAQDCGLPRG